MSIHTMRLGLGILFLVLAAITFGRTWLMPDSGRPMTLAGVFALVFGLLNLTKWYVARSHRRNLATPVRPPLQPDPSATRDEPPNPELDFTRPRGDGA